MNESNTISIIVIVYNGEETIGDCLESLMKLTYPSEKREVIVVDNASTDTTPSIIKQYPVQYIYEPRRGRAIARNTGVQAASGEYLAFIDADCIAESPWVNQIMGRFSNDDAIGAVAGAVLAEPVNPIERYIAYRKIVDQEKMLEPGRCCSPPFALTANLVLRKKVFETIGLFDQERLPITGEDADLCWRMQWAGFKLAYEPSAKVWHKHRSSIASLFKQVYGYGFSNVSLFAKHRVHFKRRAWIDLRYYAWLIKAILKIPYSQIVERDSFMRRLPYYDMVANFAIIYGKIRGSLYHKCLVL